MPDYWSWYVEIGLDSNSLSKEVQFWGTRHGIWSSFRYRNTWNR